jgi:hypothetical protein
MPELTPHESSMYIFLYRNSFLAGGEATVRIGQRTLGQKYGRGPKMSVPSRAHITRQVDQLEKKGCIIVGDTTREGTLYTVVPPEKVPLVVEKLSIQPAALEIDWYKHPERRKELFERDHWTCRFCGEAVDEKNATLDHFDPQHSGGGHTKENLHTACLLCNSIKSGKSYEEAAPLLLKSVAERRSKRNGS